MSKFGWYFPIKSVFELHLILAENNANSKIAARKNDKVWLILSRLNAILSQRAAVADAIRRLWVVAIK